jgi:hypothetical protein
MLDLSLDRGELVGVAVDEDDVAVVGEFERGGVAEAGGGAGDVPGRGSGAGAGHEVSWVGVGTRDPFAGVVEGQGPPHRLEGEGAAGPAASRRAVR